MMVSTGKDKLKAYEKLNLYWLYEKSRKFLMRIAYVNTFFQAKHGGGGHVHMDQFVANSVAIGHEIWMYPNYNHPLAHVIPTTRLAHIRTMRQMDVQYVRIERATPKICAWSLPPRRFIYGFPVVVWEFNTIPDEILSHDRVYEDLQIKNNLRSYSRGCDLAICVTPDLAEIVREKLGIKRVLVVPNGSDPELFRPDVPISNRMIQFQDKFNVVWIGSADESWNDFKMLREAAQITWETNSDKQIIFHILGPNLIGKMAEMPQNVYYWGAEYYEKLPNWLTGMDVGLSLYRTDSMAVYGSPLKVFDYMASNLAVVSTSHPVVNDLLNQLGQSEFVVPTGDSERLAVILNKLASNREQIYLKGQAGRELVINHYNWRRAVQDTMAEIEAILREKKRQKST